MKTFSGDRNSCYGTPERASARLLTVEQSVEKGNMMKVGVYDRHGIVESTQPLLATCEIFRLSATSNSEDYVGLIYEKDLFFSSVDCAILVVYDIEGLSFLTTALRLLTLGGLERVYVVGTSESGPLIGKLLVSASSSWLLKDTKDRRFVLREVFDVLHFLNWIGN
jgi:hypothetical protein